MYARSRTVRPESWAEHRARSSSHHLALLLHLNWALAWVAWAMGRWPLLDVLDHLGSFSILVVVVAYFAGTRGRVQQRHYQAWQVIDAAQGKGGSGGRIEALEELNADNVSLVGVDADGAFLKGIELPHARLSRCNFSGSDLRDSTIIRSDLTVCNLHYTNLRRSVLTDTSFAQADLSDADLSYASLDHASLDGADLSEADLSDSNLADVQWNQNTRMCLTNLWKVRNVSAAFLHFALQHGAVQIPDAARWQQMEAAGSCGP